MFTKLIYKIDLELSSDFFKFVNFYQKKICLPVLIRGGKNGKTPVDFVCVLRSVFFRKLGQCFVFLA
jgi:hypothetical protein